MRMIPRAFTVAGAANFDPSSNSRRFSFRGTAAPLQIAIARATVVAAAIALTKGAAIPMPAVGTP